MVYRAWQPAFNRRVAIKLLGVVLDRSGVDRFERECAAIGALSGHPHIVTIYDRGHTETGRPYLVMELLNGGSLASRLDLHGRVPWSTAMELGVKIAGALEAAHRAGILHRDVKPENVMLSRFGEPKLGDFGIARIHGGRETEGVTTATLAHVAPEVLAGGRPTVASDVYSLGSTLFTLLTGSAPFYRPGEENLFALIRRIAENPIPDMKPFGVPSAVCAVVGQALDKDPANRPASAGRLAGLFQEVQAAGGFPVTPLAIELEEARPDTTYAAIEDLTITPPPSDGLGPAGVSPDPRSTPRFRPLQVLSRSDRGRVWRAHDDVLDRDVVLKELRPPPSPNRAPPLKTMVEQARAAARLEHPNLVAVHDVNDDGERLLVAMELVASPTLEAVLRTLRPRSGPAVREIMAQVASALDAAHRAGITHRRLRAANVFWTRDGRRAQVADLGLSGNRPVMSPERARGLPAGPAADVFAWGVLAYELATGRDPFGAAFASDAPGLADRIVHDEVQPVDLPEDPALVALITRAMAKDPGDRPANGGALGGGAGGRRQCGAGRRCRARAGRGAGPSLAPEAIHAAAVPRRDRGGRQRGCDGHCPRRRQPTGDARNHGGGHRTNRTVNDDRGAGHDQNSHERGACVRSGDGGRRDQPRGVLGRLGRQRSSDGATADHRNLHLHRGSPGLPAGDLHRRRR